MLFFSLLFNDHQKVNFLYLLSDSQRSDFDRMLQPGDAQW